MGKTSVSFNLLDERVQRWIWHQGWSNLKTIQENSIPVVLACNSDVIISASTAGGKTEAAFLPILTSIMQNKNSLGYQVLYISPLKALINDQYARLSDMTKDLGISVTPWHGDIGIHMKTDSLKTPNGILIITPESLESFLINRKLTAITAFSSLRYVVIDEFHSFVGTERGKQLQSLLSRIEQIIHHHIPRIAMSATFSDYKEVEKFLRNDGSMPCVIPSQGDSDHEIKILVKEFVSSKRLDETIPISEDIFNNLRGNNHLVFTNSRNEAEKYAVRLSDMCERNGVPNEFRVHHGNISKIERECIEHDLQKGEYPVTALCTSTLELGIDIGKVKSIAQIGSAQSVSGLRQRLGRSGRRNEPSMLRIFSIDRKEDGLQFDLRFNLVQNIAVIELMREHKYEKADIHGFHFSTLVQQILSIISQFGGFYPKDGWLLLCKNGAFKNITPELFLDLLKSLGENNIISQLNTGQIIIGKEGERILKTPDFYTSFVATDDFTVIDRENYRSVGMIQFVPEIGQVILLSGRRWYVESVNCFDDIIYVTSCKTGGYVNFYGNSEGVSEMISRKMHEIYQVETLFPYLDDSTRAKDHLICCRNFFQNNNLADQQFLYYGNTNYYFTWSGTKFNMTLALLAKYLLQKQCDYTNIYVTNLTSKDIETMVKFKRPSALDLVSQLSHENKLCQKYDYLLSDKLLDLEYSNTYLVDVDSLFFNILQ